MHIDAETTTQISTKLGGNEKNLVRFDPDPSIAGAMHTVVLIYCNAPIGGGITMAFAQCSGFERSQSSQLE